MLEIAKAVIMRDHLGRSGSQIRLSQNPSIEGAENVWMMLLRIGRFMTDFIGTTAADTLAEGCVR